AVAEFANQREHFPFDVGGRPFGRIVEENLVLDLQPPQLLIEQIQFFVNGHRHSPDPSLAFEARGWRGSRRTRQGWNESTQGQLSAIRSQRRGFFANQLVR